MSGLPILETIIFMLAIAMYIAAAIIGIIQLRPSGEKYKKFMQPAVYAAIVLQIIFLALRAAAIKAVPLTGLFESMIVLTIVFALIYLFLSITIKQVWFSSVIVWAILAITLLTLIVAKPAAEPAKIAGTPWAIAHAVAMIFGGVSVTFATATALLYLLGSHKLKQKQIMQVLGKVPNIEQLENMNLQAIRASFVFITIGLTSGIALAVLRFTMLGISISQWLTDVKVIGIIAAWILLAVMLILNKLVLLKDKARATMTVVVFAVVLFAILGATILGVTRHHFAG